MDTLVLILMDTLMAEHGCFFHSSLAVSNGAVDPVLLPSWPFDRTSGKQAMFAQHQRPEGAPGLLRDHTMRSHYSQFKTKHFWQEIKVSLR